jgi:hypothetical protein
MKSAKQQFAERLVKAMEAAGHEAKPAVLEREFNLRYMGTPMTLHGVRRWLLGETLPSAEKMDVLGSWLKVSFAPARPGKAGKRMVREEGAKASWQASIPPQERELVDTFLALPVQQRKIIREVIMAFARTAK